MRKEVIQKLVPSSYISVILEYDYYFEYSIDKIFNDSKLTKFDILFSLDNRRIFIKTSDGSILIWNSHNNTQKTIEEKIVFADMLDSSYFVTQSENNLIKIWNSRTLECGTIIDNLPKIINITIFDKKIYIFLTDMSVCVWKNAKLKIILKSPIVRSNFCVIAKNVFILYDFHHFEIWKNKQCIYRFIAYNNKILNITRLFEDQFIIKFDEYFQVWRLHKFQFKLEKPIVCYEFIHPYIVTYTGFDLIIYDSETGYEVFNSIIDEKIVCFGALPNNRLVAGHINNSFRIWNLETQKREGPYLFGEIFDRNKSVTDLRVLKDGRFIVKLNTGQLIIWK